MFEASPDYSGGSVSNKPKLMSELKTYFSISMGKIKFFS